MQFITQFYVEPTAVRGDSFILTGDEARHAVQVLRHKKGDRIVASDGLGRTYEAEVLTISSKELAARILTSEVGKNEPKTEVTLAIGLTKGEKLDWLVEKATEMGAFAIWPFFAHHSEVKWDEKQVAKTVSRWQRVALAAFKQCGRSVVPKLEVLPNLAEVINRKGDAELVVAHPVEAPGGSFETRSLGRKVIGIIGPEGGFAPEELDTLRQAGGRFVLLGPRRLRTETAGLVLLSRVLTLKAEL
ncbi:MAG: 16S rRNA (uracil(1498)-N(3))-methyltransferase [candidate division Zixibacteria bacterium]|nr:16S rRNA (uracil(1498)-N(3))-methyltransferase [candidate division Zixibacteria bacterium]